MNSSKDTQKNQRNNFFNKDLIDELKDRNKILPEKILMSWKAPTRAFKKRDKEFWLTIVTMVAIGGVIMFIAEGYMPVILIIAVVFLYYILNTVEPELTEYKITNKGISVGENKTPWTETGGRFWTANRFNNKVVVIETLDFPFHLELYTLNVQDLEKIKKYLTQYLIEERIPSSNVDRVTNWISKKIPGNN